MKPSRARALLAFASICALAGCAAGPRGEAVPESVYGAYLTGRYAELSRQPGDAADRYFSALKIAPRDGVLLDNAVESALAAGDLVRAAQAARLAEKGGTRVELGRLTLAAVALGKGEYAPARRQLDGLMGTSFDRVAGRILAAWALAGEGQADQAAQSLSEGPENAPFARLLDAQRGLILEYAGRTDAALAAYARSERNGVRLAPALLRHALLLERGGRKQEATALLGGFLEHGEEPNIAAALQRIEAGLPPPPQAAASPAEGAAIGLFSLAGVLMGQTDASYYLPYLILALSLDPGFDNARLLYSEGLRENGRLPAARATLEEIPASAPAYELARTRIAWLWRQEGDTAQALSVVRAAAAQTKGRTARLALADMERSLENWAEAERLYDGLVREGPVPGEDWTLLYARGAVRERLGRWREGEADLKAALLLSPDQPEVLNYLGYTWIDRGENLKQGLALLEKAVSLQPESGYIVDSLGWAQFKLGDLDNAVQTLERAVELMPDDHTLNDHLGDVYWRLQRRAEARFQWRRALSQEPPLADRAAIEAKLSGGLPARAARAAAVK